MFSSSGDTNKQTHPIKDNWLKHHKGNYTKTSSAIWKENIESELNYGQLIHVTW